MLDFLADCSDPEAACEEYRAEYERRLSALYPEATCSVELGETNGMDTWYWINGERIYSRDEYPGTLEVFEQVADDLVKDWRWLTVA